MHNLSICLSNQQASHQQELELVEQVVPGVFYDCTNAASCHQEISKKG